MQLFRQKLDTQRMGASWCWKLLALTLLTVECANDGRCPQVGCLATLQPVVAIDGQVFLNSCVAACYGAVIVVDEGNLGEAAGRTAAASRWASPTVLLRYEAEGYVFVGFAQARKLSPAQHTTAAASGRRSVRAYMMQQLVKPHSVLRYDVETGAVYNAKVTGMRVDLLQLPGGVAHAAKRQQQQQQQQHDLSRSPLPVDGGGDADSSGNSSAGGDASQELMLNPDIVIDLPLKRNSSSPSPRPRPAAAGSSNSSSSSPRPAVPKVNMDNIIVTSSSSSSSSSSSLEPAVTVGGPEAPGSPSPPQAASPALTDASPSPIPSPMPRYRLAAATSPTSETDHGFGSSFEGQVLHTDDSSRTAVPLSAIGQLLSHGQEGYCSASLIAERTLLTAARCVYDPLTASWAGSLSFAASTFSEAVAGTSVPAGAVAVTEVFIVGGFAVSEPHLLLEKDMAVVKLAPGTALSSKLGHLGIFVPAAAAQQERVLDVQAAAGADRATASSSGRNAGSRKLARQQDSSAAAAAASSNKPTSSWHGTLSTAGNPTDGQPASLITSECLVEQLPGTAHRFATMRVQLCSTAPGQSGGPLFDAAGNVGGVVSYSAVGSQASVGGCAMTPWLWLNLVSPTLA